MDSVDGQPDLFSSVEDAESSVDEEVEQKRQNVLDKIDSFVLDTQESKVAYLLNRYPDTRNSDISLLLQYWRTFHKEKVAGDVVRLEELYHLPRASSLVRVRARIQNTYRLFQAVHEVRKHRGMLGDEEKDKENESYDAMVISEIRRRMQIDARAIFDGKLHIERMKALDSAFSPGVELADLFTGCVNRVMNHESESINYKDDFAEYFLDVAGMSGGLVNKESSGDQTVLLSL